MTDMSQLGNGALIPLEMCTVPPGQIMRKQVPDDKVKAVVEFATKRPEERLASIRMGLGVRILHRSPQDTHC